MCFWSFFQNTNSQLCLRFCCWSIMCKHFLYQFLAYLFNSKYIVQIILVYSSITEDSKLMCRVLSFRARLKNKNNKNRTWCWIIKIKMVHKRNSSIKIAVSRIYLKVLSLFACLQSMFVPGLKHNASNWHMEYVLHLLKRHWARMAEWLKPKATK